MKLEWETTRQCMSIHSSLTQDKRNDVSSMWREKEMITVDVRHAFLVQSVHHRRETHHLRHATLLLSLDDARPSWCQVCWLDFNRYTVVWDGQRPERSDVCLWRSSAFDHRRGMGQAKSTGERSLLVFYLSLLSWESIFLIGQTAMDQWASDKSAWLISLSSSAPYYRINTRVVQWEISFYYRPSTR